MSAIENYAAPHSLEDAARLLTGGGASLLAGGTDLMPQTRTGTREFRSLLLNLRRIPELKGIALEGGEIRIGAACTVAEILEDPLLRERASILPAAADCFASGQLRNSATIGGNICNASPAGDMIAPTSRFQSPLDASRFRLTSGRRSKSGSSSMSSLSSSRICCADWESPL